MRLLCDHHVAIKYSDTFEAANWITCRRVADVLSSDTSDAEIAQYAAANNYIVFTNDDDFQVETLQHDLITYDQMENPSPRDVVDALQAINETYDDTTRIWEHVPDGWV